MQALEQKLTLLLLSLDHGAYKNAAEQFEKLCSEHLSHPVDAIMVETADLLTTALRTKFQSFRNSITTANPIALESYIKKAPVLYLYSKYGFAENEGTAADFEQKLEAIGNTENDLNLLASTLSWANLVFGLDKTHLGTTVRLAEENTDITGDTARLLLSRLLEQKPASGEERAIQANLVKYWAQKLGLWDFSLNSFGTKFCLQNGLRTYLLSNPNKHGAAYLEKCLTDTNERWKERENYEMDALASIVGNIRWKGTEVTPLSFTYGFKCWNWLSRNGGGDAKETAIDVPAEQMHEHQAFLEIFENDEVVSAAIVVPIYANGHFTTLVLWRRYAEPIKCAYLDTLNTNAVNTNLDKLRTWWPTICKEFGRNFDPNVYVFQFATKQKASECPMNTLFIMDELCNTVTNRPLIVDIASHVEERIALLVDGMQNKTPLPSSNLNKRISTLAANWVDTELKTRLKFPVKLIDFLLAASSSKVDESFLIHRAAYLDSLSPPTPRVNDTYSLPILGGLTDMVLAVALRLADLASTADNKLIALYISQIRQVYASSEFTVNLVRLVHRMAKIFQAPRKPVWLWVGDREFIASLFAMTATFSGIDNQQTDEDKGIGAIIKEIWFFLSRWLEQVELKKTDDQRRTAGTSNAAESVQRITKGIFNAVFEQANDKNSRLGSVDRAVLNARLILLSNLANASAASSTPSSPSPSPSTATTTTATSTSTKSKGKQKQQPSSPPKASPATAPSPAPSAPFGPTSDPLAGFTPAEKDFLRKVIDQASAEDELKKFTLEEFRNSNLLQKKVMVTQAIRKLYPQAFAYIDQVEAELQKVDAFLLDLEKSKATHKRKKDNFPDIFDRFITDGDSALKRFKEDQRKKKNWTERTGDAIYDLFSPWFLRVDTDGATPFTSPILVDTAFATKYKGILAKDLPKQLEDWQTLCSESKDNLEDLSKVLETKKQFYFNNSETMWDAASAAFESESNRLKALYDAAERVGAVFIERPLVDSLATLLFHTRQSAWDAGWIEDEPTLKAAFTPLSDWTPTTRFDPKNVIDPKPYLEALGIFCLLCDNFASDHYRDVTGEKSADRNLFGCGGWQKFIFTIPTTAIALWRDGNFWASPIFDLDVLKERIQAAMGAYLTRDYINDDPPPFDAIKSILNGRLNELKPHRTIRDLITAVLSQASDPYITNTLLPSFQSLGPGPFSPAAPRPLPLAAPLPPYAAVPPPPPLPPFAPGAAPYSWTVPFNRTSDDEAARDWQERAKKRIADRQAKQPQFFDYDDMTSMTRYSDEAREARARADAEKRERLQYAKMLAERARYERWSLMTPEERARYPNLPWGGF